MKLNVLHVTDTLAGGGFERLLVRSLAAIDRTRFAHQVCCISAGGIYERDLRALGIPCHILRRRRRFDPSVIWQLAGHMRRERIDVVHTLNFTANAWGRVAARLAGVRRVIAHERGTAWTESRLMRSVDRRLYRLTDLWLANSEAARIVLTTHLGLSAERIRVVYNGIAPAAAAAGSGGGDGGGGDGGGDDASRTASTGLRERFAIAPGAPVVITVGRLDTPKGHLSLLRAAPIVWRSMPETHFVLVGDGPLREWLVREAERLDLPASGRFHFAGFVGDAPALMRDADLLLHPSIRESFGNVLVEAALARLPVVASNIDGIAEVVRDGETGLLLDGTLPVETALAAPPGASPVPAVVVDGRTRRLRPPRMLDPEALAAATVALLGDPARRARLGEQAAARARELFSLERYARDLERAYLGEL